MPSVNSGSVSDKIYNTRRYKIRTLIFPFSYAIINTRAAGLSDKPLISFFQAKKERVKSFFSVSWLSFFVIDLYGKKSLPEL